MYENIVFNACGGFFLFSIHYWIPWEEYVEKKKVEYTCDAGQRDPCVGDAETFQWAICECRGAPETGVNLSKFCQIGLGDGVSRVTEKLEISQLKKNIYEI